ncbi:repressor of the inhibitor of the protein kinase [Merluccius polli]|uniref:Repressor of the inhibitor of the protein kinase n=1 Tax=Merluccius polli TaxID=89951 RepID=A0AA47M8B7_MERPO|nr:repressor of the inhibitor of the protein kinase [Merluccius polli]
MRPLTKQLQATNLDIITVYEEARNATALANSVDVVPAKQRISVKQNYRPNVPTESLEDHYMVNVFYPFIDHITSELDARFSQRNEPAMLAAYLVPKALKKLTEERVVELVEWYREDLPDPDTVEREIECWRHKFHSEDESLPKSALETLQATQMAFFPNIKCMLKMFLTLPVTFACERSFSAMRRRKTWLRASMSTGLALMHVHWKLKIDKERVLRRHLLVVDYLGPDHLHDTEIVVPVDSASDLETPPSAMKYILLSALFSCLGKEDKNLIIKYINTNV